MAADSGLFDARKKFNRIERPATEDERKRHAEIRQKIMQECPPAPAAGREESPPGLPTQVRRARAAKGLTWYALAKLAGIPDPNTVRDIESGRDAQLSTVQQVAKARGLRLDLVEETVPEETCANPPRYIQRP